MAATAESRDQVALRAVKAEAKDVTAELQNVLAGLLRNPEDLFLQNVKTRLEGHKEKLESRRQTLESVIAGKDSNSAAPAVRALPPPAELNAAYERRVQQHPQPPKQLLAQQQGRGASSAPSSSSSALPAPAADAADVPLLFNWRIDRQLGLAAAAAASAKARKAAASAASAAGSSGADNSAADVRADAAAVAAGGLLLPQLAHPVLAHVLRLVEGGDAAAGVSGTGVAEEDVVAAAELIETVCGYGQQTDEVQLAAAVQDVLLPYLFGPSFDLSIPAGTATTATTTNAAGETAAVGFVRHATTIARPHHASSSSPFSPLATPRWAVGDDAAQPSHLFLLAEFRTGLGASGGSGSPTADPAFVGATHYLDFWQRAQQRRQQQPLGPAAGPAAGSGGLQADVWGLQTYRPALLLEVLGPNLRLSALSWTDRPVVTPLTPLLPLLPLHDPQLLLHQHGPAAAAAAAPSDDDRLLLPVARLLSGLRSGLRWLAALNHRARSQQQPLTAAISAEQTQQQGPVAAAAAAAPVKRRRVKTASAPATAAAAEAAPVGGSEAEAGGAVAAVPAVVVSSRGSNSTPVALPYPILLSRRYDTRGAAPPQALGPRTFLLHTSTPHASEAASSGAPARDVVVRLARAYDLEAHREWEALGLAPALLRSRRLRSGWLLVESEHLPVAPAAAGTSSSPEVADGRRAWQPLQSLLASSSSSAAVDQQVDWAGALAAVKSALQRGSAGGGRAAAAAASRAAEALGTDVTAAAAGWLVRRGSGAAAWEAQLVDFRVPDAASRRRQGLAASLKAIAERKRLRLQQQLEAAAAELAAAESAAAEAAAVAAAAAELAAAGPSAAVNRKRSVGRPAGSRGTVVSAASGRSTKSRDEAAAVKDSTAGSTAAAKRSTAPKNAGTRGAGSSGTTTSGGASRSGSSSSSAGAAVVKGRSRRGTPPPPAAMLPAPHHTCVSAVTPPAAFHLLRPRVCAGQRSPHLGARLRVLGW